MRVSDGRLILHFEVRLRRAAVLLSVAALAGGLIGAWTILRNNGLLGGLDHDGPLDALSGFGSGMGCSTAPIQISLDHMRNTSGDQLIIDRVRIVGSTPREGLLVSDLRTFDGSKQGGGAGGAPGDYKLIDPHPAVGTVVPAHGDRGLSYVIRWSGLYGGIPLPEHSSVDYRVRGFFVDYHSGSRHFRESGGGEVRMPCHGKKAPPPKPRTLPGHT